jgi:hypothetical protein
VVVAGVIAVVAILAVGGYFAYQYVEHPASSSTWSVTETGKTTCANNYASPWTLPLNTSATTVRFTWVTTGAGVPYNATLDAQAPNGGLLYSATVPLGGGSGGSFPTSGAGDYNFTVFCTVTELQFAGYYTATVTAEIAGAK